jgi:hypothetical protein
LEFENAREAVHAFHAELVAGEESLRYVADDPIFLLAVVPTDEVATYYARRTASGRNRELMNFSAHSIRLAQRTGRGTDLNLILNSSE